MVPQPLTLDASEEEAITKRNPRDILENDLLQQLMLSYQPDLIRDSTTSKAVLQAIHEYLFVYPALQSRELEELIGFDFYLTLYGLKALLREHNLNKISLSLEENKRQFAQWLVSEMQED